MSQTSKLRIGPGVKVLDEPLRSIAEFENWKHSVLYNLRLDGDFKNYLSVDFGIKTKLKPNRSLVDDTTGENKKTAAQKCEDVDFMLSQIAQYCPTIPHNDIIKDCASLSDVWQVVRMHSSLETSGSLLNDTWNITRNPDERPLALWSRLKQAYDDNLLRKDTLIYKTGKLTQDEELTPTLHCTIILHWLHLLHPKLRDLVTTKFATELRGKTYAAIFPEISKSVDSLLKELNEDPSICRYHADQEAASICRYGDNRFSGSRYSASSRARGSYPRSRGFSRPQATSSRHCEYCRSQGRQTFKTHNEEDCLFLKRERRYQPQGSSRAFGAIEDSTSYDPYDDHYNEYYEEYPAPEDLRSMVVTEHLLNRVSICASPVLTLYHHKVPYQITLDSGGTCNAVSASIVKKTNSKVRPTQQSARMADGKSSLSVLGETDIDFHRDGKVFKLTALVCEMSEDTVLAGMPFLTQNDIAIRPAVAEIIIDGTEVIKYNPEGAVGPSKLRTVSSYTLHSTSRTIVLPGEAVEFKLPAHMTAMDSVAIEPRTDSSFNRSHSSKSWPEPQVQQVVDGKISIVNTSTDPIPVKKHEQVCVIQLPVSDKDVAAVRSVPHTTPVKSVPDPTPVDPVAHSSSTSPSPKKVEDYSSLVTLNPDNVLSDEEASSFAEILHRYDEVFNPSISTYNGRSGPCFVEVNMGPHPPTQRKGRIPPFYGRDNLEELGQKFDKLIEKGVFRRPQEVGVTVENVNPSFLVKKKSSNDKRLVTDFSSIASFCRPTPTLMPDVEVTMRKMAPWRYILKSDFTESYFQLFLRKSSQKYCGVVHPTKGVFVYQRGCMGLPGTEVALEELTCLLFGELVMQGKVAKMADDVIMGASTVSELLDIFEEVLGIMLQNNLRFSAKKTFICPRSVVIMGWLWIDGCLQASSHVLSPLSECDPPETVKALKSYIGAYRFLSRVIKDYASLLSPLEAMVVGKVSKSAKIEWKDEQLLSFQKAQKALKHTDTIVLPKPDDILWIVTDAASTPGAIGATLYAVRGEKTLLGGFYNAKLPKFQQKWLPCEQEGIAIGMALKHFSPLIIQSSHKPCILTDSKPCVDAVEKLSRGEYSASARLTTFLSSVSRYQAVVKHISGVANTTSDFISRNPVPCDTPSCQICKFIRQSMEAVVGAYSVRDVEEGRVHLPFINKGAWVDIQNECKDLRRLKLYIQNGTSPGKNGRNMRMVKRYLSSKVVISKEGALVVRDIQTLGPILDRIVIPQQVLHGILTMYHLRLEHPTCYQLTRVVNRYFFALNLDKVAASVTEACHVCAALKLVPSALITQSTEDPPEHVGQTYAADVLKRSGQKILVLRECTSSYTLANFIERETADDTSAALIQLCHVMRPSPLCPITIRVDPASSHKSLFVNSDSLKAQNISLVLGRVHNTNKNPVAEKSMRELIRELLILSPQGGRISQAILSQALANMNSRFRGSGLSAHEVYTQREQASGLQLNLKDEVLIADQHRRRVKSHKHSEKSKAHGRPRLPAAEVVPGSIVYLYKEGSKLKARSRYLVISVKDGWCQVKRLTDQRLSSQVYPVKLEEVYKVKDAFDVPLPAVLDESSEEDDLLLMHNAETSSEVDPCVMCNSDVTASHEALQCDTCTRWCHIDCCGVSQEQYEELLDRTREFDWSCPQHPPRQVEAGNESVIDPDDPTYVPPLDEPDDEGGIQERASTRTRKPPDRFQPS